MSAVEDVQYSGGYHECCRGCSLQWGNITSTAENVSKCCNKSQKCHFFDFFSIFVALDIFIQHFESNISFFMKRALLPHLPPLANDMRGACSLFPPLWCLWVQWRKATSTLCTYYLDCACGLPPQYSKSSAALMVSQKLLRIVIIPRWHPSRVPKIILTA